MPNNDIRSRIWNQPIKTNTLIIFSLSYSNHLTSLYRVHVCYQLLDILKSGVNYFPIRIWKSFYKLKGFCLQYLVVSSFTFGPNFEDYVHPDVCFKIRKLSVECFECLIVIKRIIDGLLDQPAVLPDNYVIKPFLVYIFGLN